MKTRMVRISLIASMALCVGLAATLVLVLRGQHKAHSPEEDAVIARGPQAGANAAPAPAAAGTEPALGPLQVSPERLQQIGVTTATVEWKNVSQQISAPGNVDIDEQKLSYVQTRFSGWIQNVYANATYQYVRKGQRLFTIYSPDLVSSEQEYLLARENQGAFANDAHGMAVQESGWLTQAATERLRQFGVSEQTVGNLEKTNKVQREIEVDSPASGFITERNALPNAYVQPDMKLYTIADLSTVWVYANVFQTDVGRLKPGDAADVTVDAYPGRTFKGRIDQILPQVDMTTRTVRVRLVFSNPGVALKPGMYVNVAISIPLGRQLVVPSSAVLQAGARTVAFLDHGNGSLEPRDIQIGPQVDDATVVLSGLAAGDKVVSSANFLVDSEAQLQSAFAAPAAQPPAQKAQSSAAAPVKIDFSTQPAPPQKGSNTVRVKLSSPDGSSVSNLQVSASFFMPAMPAMGMAAAHETATLADKGNGAYEGSVKLGSGGTWQVTITVQRNGQTIANRQLSVSATGGM